MKTIIYLAPLLLVLGTFGPMKNQPADASHPQEKRQQSKDSTLKHVVLFSFKENTPADRIREIEEAFVALQQKIPQIQSFEWGLNNSPENLNKGFTHCFILSFKNEADRAVYLPHPAHKAFGSLLGSSLKDVLVIDFWSS